MGFLTVILYIWALFDVWALYFMTKQMFFRNKYMWEDKSKYKEEWLPFVRNDRANWKYFEIYFCTIFFMFWRTLIIVGASLFLEIVLRLLFIKPRDVNQVLPAWKVYLREFFLRTMAYLILFACGFYHIPLIQKKISDYDPTYAQNAAQNEGNINKNQRAPICISNHVTWIDTIYYVYRKQWSFLSKKQLMNAPLFGISVITLQGIFLSREDSTDRNDATQKIDERIRLIDEGKNLPPIIIFPEGTVSNGDYLISFKKGAFHMMTPIQIMCSKYGKRNFDPYLCPMSQAINAFFLMAQFQNELVSYEFDSIYPENLPLQSQDDWEGYAQYCQNIMAQCLGVQQSEAGYRHMRDYEKYLFGDQHGSNPSSANNTPEKKDVHQKQE